MRRSESHSAASESNRSEFLALSGGVEPLSDRGPSVGSAIDVDFAVPFRHRLRFTDDVFGGDRGVLLDLLEPSGTGRPKVFACVDDGLLAGRSTLREDIATVLDDRAVRLVGDVVTVEGGERSKNDPAVVDRLLAEIDAHDLDRRSYVVVIGGGAVLDAVGYAAAVAHRGIRLVRLPTTTLGQADSGVGVKNAVNMFGKKNWCGTFATPWAVINDEALLGTLSDRDFRSGFAEAVKVALLKDRQFFERIAARAAAIGRRDPADCGPVLRESAAWHLRHITRGGDPFEFREARPLDFGHWSAHKLEPMSEYTIRHGEAVAIGVAIDVAYSHLVHGLSRQDRDAVHRTLRDLGLPVWHPLLAETATLVEGLEEFRQHLGGRLTVTMLRAPGDPIDVHEIDSGVMREAIASVRERVTH